MNKNTNFVKKCEEFLTQKYNSKQTVKCYLKEIELFLENQDEATSLRSAHEFSESVYKFFKQDGKYWNGFFPNLSGEYYNLPRQHFPKSYLPNGYIDIVRPMVFMNYPTFHGDKVLSFITPHAIEIDTLEDFERLEQRYKNV